MTPPTTSSSLSPRLGLRILHRCLDRGGGGRGPGSSFYFAGPHAFKGGGVM